MWLDKRIPRTSPESRRPSDADPDRSGQNVSPGTDNPAPDSLLVDEGWRFPVTPRICLAIAGQTFRYCVRRKVLLVLVLFAAFLLVSALVAPRSFPAKRLELVVRASLMGTAFFSVIVVVFLSATALPEDVSNRTIFTVLTKPVGRLNYLLGRILGFSLMALVLLAVMGLVSVGFIRFTAWRVSSELKDSRLLEARRHARPWTVSVRSTPDAPDEPPPVEEDTGKLALSGAASRTMVFFFSGGDLRGRSTEEVTVSFDVEVRSGAMLPKCEVVLLARNPITGRTSQQQTVLDSGRRSTVTFESTVVDPDRGMELHMRRLSAGGILAGPDGVTVVLSPVWFEVAYGKALLIVFFGLAVLAVISVCASSYVTKWLAVVVGFVAYLLGSFSQVINDLIVTLSSDTGTQGFLGTGLLGRSQPGQTVEPNLVIQILNKIYLVLFKIVTFIIPDFRTFDAGSPVVAGYDVPFRVLAGALWVGSVYFVVYLVLAHLLWHRREVGL